MSVDIDLKRRLFAIENLNAQIKREIERYKKNKKTVSRNLITQRIQKLEKELKSKSISDHFSNLIQKAFDKAKRKKSPEKRLFQMEEDLIKIFTFGKIKKRDRETLRDHLDEMQLVRIDEETTTVSYPDIVEKIISAFHTLLDQADESRTLAKTSKKNRKRTLRKSLYSFCFGLTAIVCNGLTGQYFEFSLGVGLTALYYGGRALDE